MLKLHDKNLIILENNIHENIINRDVLRCIKNGRYRNYKTQNIKKMVLKLQTHKNVFLYNKFDQIINYQVFKTHVETLLNLRNN